MGRQIQVERTRSNGLPVAIERRGNVTDRALRYRANETPPSGERQCAFCGSRENVEIEHVDGFEENNEPHNLMWACRSCNTQKGIVFRNAGRGRRTRQYNPAGEGATSMEQWIAAVMSLKGNGQMGLSDAIALVHDTPQHMRSHFAHQIWAMRRRRGTDKTGTPF